MGKNLLIIGNGFDLANNLPTKYGQFMDFAQCFMAIFSDEFKRDEYVYFWRIEIFDRINGNHIDESQFLNKNIEELIKQYYEKQRHIDGKEFSEEEKLIVDNLRKCLDNNIIYDYFCKIRYKIPGDNWIDFESEISFLIRWLDVTDVKLTDPFSKIDFDKINQKLKEPDKLNIDEVGKIRQFGTLANEYKWHSESRHYLLGEFIENLYDDLRRLTVAIEIYLSEFVEKNSGIQTNDVESIRSLAPKPDMVLSFNYTDTYQKYYDSNAEVCYVHGKCRDKDYDTENSNLVLGIDEYLPADRRDDDNRYAIFKKFIQRIRNHNESSYFKWQEEMEQNYKKFYRMFNSEPVIDNVSSLPDEAFSDVWVFGHSLDITDRDILARFLKPDYTRVHIFAQNKLDEGRLATRLVRIMTEDIMIQKSGADRMLTFERS